MSINSAPDQSRTLRVFLCGATGTIGQATTRALVAQGYEVICLIRRPSELTDLQSIDSIYPFLQSTQVLFGEISDPQIFKQYDSQLQNIDVIVSCLASRSGLPEDAWHIDYGANLNLLNWAKASKISQFILLSAICLQRPLLAFQQAKLAFEKLLMTSGISYTIVRPTAFFKSLSGQIQRIQQGKPFLVFGDGQLTACKPISDRDLGNFMASCINNKERHNTVLPIGGPGQPITPLEQARILFKLLKKEPKIKKIPIRLMDCIIFILSTLGIFLPKFREKAELAKIGKYYATQSMLVLDPISGNYNAELTPSFGKDTLEAYYAAVIYQQIEVNLREHAVF